MSSLYVENETNTKQYYVKSLSEKGASLYLILFKNKFFKILKFTTYEHLYRFQRKNTENCKSLQYKHIVNCNTTNSVNGTDLLNSI